MFNIDDNFFKMILCLLWLKKIIWGCNCHSEAKPQSRYTRIKGNNVEIWVGNKNWASIDQGKEYCSSIPP